MPRNAQKSRTTSETEISLSLVLDGTGRSSIVTGVGFFDHMLTALARHGGFDLDIAAKGDLHIDAHHTVEDVGIVLGSALRQALGDKRGIARFGHALVPMDEALGEAAVDISGRAHLAWHVHFARETLGTMDTQLFEEFFRALVGNALITLHVTSRAGTNAHHVAEACFKAVSRALRMAVASIHGWMGRFHHQGGAVKIFTSHLRAGEPPRLVAENFSWAAFLFGFLFLATHRAWVAAALNLAALVLAGLLVRATGTGAPLLGLAMLQGLFANDVRRWTLARRGFVPGPVVAAGDRDVALARLLTERGDLVPA